MILNLNKINPPKKIERLGKRTYADNFDLMYKDCGKDNVIVAYLDYLDYQVLRHVSNNDTYLSLLFESNKLKKYVIVGFYIISLSLVTE